MEDSGPKASPPVVYCRWDYCGQTFMTYPEWETHFTVDHLPIEKVQDLSNRVRRKRHDGQWELIQSSFNLPDALPLDIGQSQETGDTSIVTSHTWSYLDPSPFVGNTMSMPTHVILPPRSSQEVVSNHDHQHNPEDDSMIAEKEDEGLPQSQGSETKSTSQIGVRSQERPGESQDSGYEIGASHDPRLRQTPPPPGKEPLFVSPDFQDGATTGSLPSIHPSPQFTPLNSSGFAALPASQLHRTPTSPAQSGNSTESEKESRRLSLTFGAAAKEIPLPETQKAGMSRGGVGFGFGQGA